jgi:uncharacterized coiled-coil protein SlyX
VAKGSIADIVEETDRIAGVVRSLDEQRDVLGSQNVVLAFQNQALRDLAAALSDTRKRLAAIESKLDEALEEIRGHR